MRPAGKARCNAHGPRCVLPFHEGGSTGRRNRGSDARRCDRPCRRASGVRGRHGVAGDSAICSGRACARDSRGTSSRRPRARRARVRQAGLGTLARVEAPSRPGAGGRRVLRHDGRCVRGWSDRRRIVDRVGGPRSHRRRIARGSLVRRPCRCDVPNRRPLGGGTGADNHGGGRGLPPWAPATRKAGRATRRAARESRSRRRRAAGRATRASTGRRTAAAPRPTRRTRRTPRTPRTRPTRRTPRIPATRRIRRSRRSPATGTGTAAARRSPAADRSYAGEIWTAPSARR